jgi:hypothetical protein
MISIVACSLVGRFQGDKTINFTYFLKTDARDGIRVLWDFIECDGISTEMSQQKRNTAVIVE